MIQYGECIHKFGGIFMKKTVGIIMGIFGIILSVVGIVVKWKESVSVSVVGGVEGPTSVFVAGRLNENAPIQLLLSGMILLVIGAVIFRKRH